MSVIELYAAPNCPALNDAEGVTYAWETFAFLAMMSETESEAFVTVTVLLGDPPFSESPVLAVVSVSVSNIGAAKAPRISALGAQSSMTCCGVHEFESSTALKASFMAPLNGAVPFASNS